MSLFGGGVPNFASGYLGSGSSPTSSSHDGGLASSGGLSAASPYSAAFNAAASVAMAASKDPSVTSSGTFSSGKSAVTFGGAKGSGASLDQNSIIVLSLAAVAVVFFVKRR